MSLHFLLGPTLEESDFLHIFSEKGPAKFNIIDLDTEIRKWATKIWNISMPKSRDLKVSIEHLHILAENSTDCVLAVSIIYRIIV